MDKNLEMQMGWNFHNTYTDLPDKLYTRIRPERVKEAEVFILNKDLARLLGLNIELLETKEGAEILSGNTIPKDTDPIAQAYAGHQFGHFTMLGDGRALLLGEHIDPNGRRYDIQFKGSGKTPYSRGGDGRAALGPMLREYIISEAMIGLGIESTRSLAVTTSGEKIIRNKIERAAILTRIASSHIRVGTFQYALAYGDKNLLKELADYTIRRHYSYVFENENPYLEFLREVIKRQANVISKWQLAGFIHGVMNTDNMTISGESIDYGPCAFMDIYNQKTVFSSIDRYGRYAYGNQPDIGAWNLARLGETLLHLISKNQTEAIQLVEEGIRNFYYLYYKFWTEGMRSKLGIFQEEEGDKEIISDLLHLMEKYRADYTNFFRDLTIEEYSKMKIYQEKDFLDWKDRWQRRLSYQGKSKSEIRELMKDNNPSIIPRNYWVEESLKDAEKASKASIEKLLQLLSRPYDYTSEQLEFSKQEMPIDKSYRTFCGT